MCFGCGIPGCGGACGCNDQEGTMQVTEDVICSECGKVYEYDGEAEYIGRARNYSYTFLSECPLCGHKQETEGGSEVEKSFKEADDYYI